MTQTKLATRDGEEYVAAVRRELADVPWRRRNDLVATVRESVGELPENALASIRLGPPAAFARDLRDSAGLPPRSRSPLALLRGVRPRALVLTGVATLVVASIVAGLVYRAHYQPTSAFASFGSSDAPVIDDPLTTSGDTNFYRYEPGKVVVSGIDVRNSGWSTVTIEGAKLRGNLLDVRELRATTDPSIGGLWERAPKVDRVSVPPGKSVMVFVVMTIAEWGELGPGTIVSTAQPTLTTRVLGVHHAVPAQGSEIAFVGPE